MQLTHHHHHPHTHPPQTHTPKKVPSLGWRKRDAKGNLGPYTWLTYSQAGDIRTSIGSGLLQLGVLPKANVGLYSVNCKGRLIDFLRGLRACV
jgi:long-subunit acyl-CoA synthetase (AMP-forming)